MLEEILRQIVEEKRRQGVADKVIINFVREYIQYLVLSLIYNQKNLKSLIFKGGSCLRVCFDMPRLSEDLDFDFNKKIFKKDLLSGLGSYLAKEIKTKHFAYLETKVQSDIRLYLKFPIIRKLGLASGSESDKLYVKVEVNDELIPFGKIDITPVSRYGFNFVVRHYDLPTLMVGKIHALIYRLWFKGKKSEIDVKGRDFYDLYWYLEKGIKPNWKSLKATTKIADKKKLKLMLLSRIEKVVTPQKLNYDLVNFFPDQEFVADFSRNYLKIIKKFFNF